MSEKKKVHVKNMALCLNYLAQTAEVSKGNFEN